MGKLLSKTGWYRKKKKSDEKPEPGKSNPAKKPGARERKEDQEEQEYKTVMFVEYTRNGELASRLRELTSRLASTLGFKVKIVERAGASIKSQFPTNNLWEGQKCGREDCTTCEQGAEMLPDCTRSSVLYENVCEQCNPEAGKDKELNEVQQDIPTL